MTKNREATMYFIINSDQNANFNLLYYKISLRPILIFHECVHMKKGLN